MNTNEPPDDKPEEWPHKEEFLRKLREEQDFAAGMRQAMEAVLALPSTPENAAAQEAARIALRGHDSFAVLGAIQQKMETATRRIIELKSAPDDEGIRALNELIDSITDDALDLPEPHRKNFITQLTALQSHVRKL